MGCFLFDYEFWGHYSKIYTCFKGKTVVVMLNIRNLGPDGGGVTFLTKPPKGTSTRFEPLCVHIRSRVVFARRLDEKGTLQKVTETLYFTYLWGIPHSTKI